jgi:prepilin-type N-terminal cleavage/methylation domain-containing protein
MTTPAGAMTNLGGDVTEINMQRRDADFELATGPEDHRRRERGFSLIEVLIASLIMLVVALGIVSLFTMAASSNLQGSDNTKAANFARERIELLWQVPFSDPLLKITGAGTTAQQFEYYDELTKKWVAMASATPPSGAMWSRITTVRQFSVDNLAAPITGDAGVANPSQVQLKEIKVEVKSQRKGGPLGGGKELTLLAYRSA